MYFNVRTSLLIKYKNTISNIVCVKKMYVQRIDSIIGTLLSVFRNNCEINLIFIIILLKTIIKYNTYTMMFNKSSEI